MRRYFSVTPQRERPRAEWYDTGPYLPGLTVFERESVAIPTGLLDKDGNKIMRTDDREPIGYLPRK